MLSHYSMSANVRQAIGTEVTNEQSVVLDFLPYFHMYGMVVFLNACVAGGVTQIILPRFDPEQMLFLVQKHRVTDLFVVPPALLALLNVASAKSYDTSSLRFVCSAAAPLAPELAEQATQTFGRPVFQGYGMSEACALANTNPLDRIKPLTGGAPVSDTVEKVVDLDTGQELRAGEAGELLIKAPQVMLGYWKRPDATAETLTEEGWLRTGDICCLDEEGYVIVLDRKKEMIKYKAYQVAPAELEGILLEHPAVMDAAVIPKRDPEVGETPKAFVVLRPDRQATKEQIMAFVAEKVAPYKKIRLMEFVQSIPKTLSGKILRRELIQQERERSESDEGA
jgi:acyl-CoA synthetase (AMP-forming)/AMP-acid ligase II